MKNNTLTKSDIDPEYNQIVIDKKDQPIFINYNGKNIKVIDDEGEEFTFIVDFSGKQNRLRHTRNFIRKWKLKKGDEIVFRQDDITREIRVHVSTVKSSDKSSEIIIATPENVNKEIEHDESYQNQSENINRTKIEEQIESVFMETVNYYKSVFMKYIPTHHNKYNASGFTERNMTFNFCRLYMEKSITQNKEIQSNDIIVWQEVPLKIGEKIEGNMDSIIIDNINKAIIFIEAKRIYGKKHVEQLENDFNRINEDYDKIPNYSEYQKYEKYAVSLVDIRIVKKARAMNRYKDYIKDEFCGRDFVNVEFGGTQGRDFEYYLNYRIDKL